MNPTLRSSAPERRMTISANHHALKSAASANPATWCVTVTATIAIVATICGPGPASWRTRPSHQTTKAAKGKARFSYANVELQNKNNGLAA